MPAVLRSSQFFWIQAVTELYCWHYALDCDIVIYQQMYFFKGILFAEKNNALFLFSLK